MIFNDRNLVRFIKYVLVPVVVLDFLSVLALWVLRWPF